MIPARTSRHHGSSIVKLLADHRSWILAIFAATNLAACAAMNFAEGAGGTDGGGSGGNNSGGSGGSIDYDAGGATSTIGDYSKLCGAGTCDVSSLKAASSCASSGSGGEGGVTNTGAGGAGGFTNSGGAGGITDTGAGGAPSGEAQCKLTFTTASVDRSCVVAGSGAEFAPCNVAADCGPGLGCVLPTDQSTGVCRYYCCGDTEDCLPGTYCAPRPMTEAADPNVKIPVCVDADNCALLAEGQCEEGTVCTVVRADGSTACLPPGAGKQGESCPCAAGYACTKLKNQCHKICHTDPGSLPTECDEGYSCQGNQAMPTGFGLCISTSEI